MTAKNKPHKKLVGEAIVFIEVEILPLKINRAKAVKEAKASYVETVCQTYDSVEEFATYIADSMAWKEEQK